MLFNSIDYAVFLPCVFLIYWSLHSKPRSVQNLFVVAASYLFYGWWDWRFLSLIFFSTTTDYLVAVGLSKTTVQSRRKMLLFASLVTNLGLLGTFKYFNFFVDTFVESFSLLGVRFNPVSFSFILPVGISFYTFQTLSYSIDVYRKKIEPTTDFIAFAAFVSFFPQLVAGPIERASNLLPQFLKPRRFDSAQASNGLRQILWGLIKKVVIADNCAVFVNTIFSGADTYSGSTLALGAFFFSFQIYGDFSGYSDIAIGTAKLMGFELMDNFAFPYFSRDISEFWRRWHISLTTWFRDYVYIPLGGSRCSKLKNVRNVFIVFVVSGLWHGADWKFVVWGAIHAGLFMPLMLLNRNRRYLTVVAADRRLPSFEELVKMVTTFSFVTLAWIFFRADDLSSAITYLTNMLSLSLFELPDFPARDRALLIFAVILVFIVVEWMGRRGRYAIEKMDLAFGSRMRWALYYGMIAAMFLLVNNDETVEFIYFQF